MQCRELRGRARGFTLLEVLIASILACGVLVTLGLWTYKAEWNQAALRRQRALGLLRVGIELHGSVLPKNDTSWSEHPALGWRLDWGWRKVSVGGWRLEGEAIGPSGKSYGHLWVARWGVR